MCGGSFMSGIASQPTQTALGGGANPLQGGSAMGGSYSPTPSITTPPPPQPGGGMKVGYDIINSPAIPGQQPQGFAALGPAIGSALGGMGAGISTTPPPMQNPFMGGQPQGMTPAQPFGQGFGTAKPDMGTGLGIPNDLGLTPYKLGQTLSAPSGGGTDQPIKYFDGDYSLSDLRDKMAAGRADTTNVFQPKLAPTLGGSPGGGMGRPMTTTQVSRPPESFHPGVPVSQGPGAGVTPEMLQKMLQGNPSGVNPFQPQQISPQQRMMDRLNQQFDRQMQPLNQQMMQLQQQYMGQPPQQLQQLQQQLQQTPEFQAMQNAAQSGNMQEADRLRKAFESSPQFQQMQQTGNAFNQQQQQAQQKMMADPRFQQLQRQVDRYQQMQQRQMQRFQPQPAQGLTAGLGSLINKGMMF